ncbi:MAG: hypothetical protein ACYDGY_11175, partial [Acidimicrobiales bacterium]
ELVAISKRHEDTLTRLEKSVAELVAISKRHEDTLTRLEKAQERTDATVDRLVKAQERTDRAIDRLAEGLGEISEVSCAAVLGAVAELKGWTLLDAPGPIDVGHGEVDVRARFSTPDGEVVLLAEAKTRLRGKDLMKWASRVGEQAWRNMYMYPGFSGQVLPYAYGTLIYADAMTEAQRLGIGLIGPEGERIAPVPL